MEAAEIPQDETQPEQTEETEGTEEASPPDLGESLQQMNQRLEELGNRLPEATEEDDILSQLTADPYDYEDDQQQQQQYAQPEEQQQGEPDETDQLRQLIGEAASEAIQQQVQPYFIQQEINQRESAIRAYAEEHPDLKGEALDAVSASLEEAGLQPDNGYPPNPIHVRMAHMAYIAEAAASEGETPAEAGGEGATLETGAGPGAPEADVDPVEQRWLDAMKGNDDRSAFD